VNDSIEELHTRVRELDERLRTWEEAALEERQRHQELAHIVDRIVEIGLRGGAWAELQDDNSLQSPHVQSNLLLPKSPSVSHANAKRTRTEPPPYPAGTVPSSNDT